LTNHSNSAIIQSQVEGNRTRAGEGRKCPRGNKMVTKNFLEKIEKVLDKCPGLWYYTIRKNEGRKKQ
jgi:hypothetical protein